MDKNIGKAIQRVVQSKKYIKRIEEVETIEYQNYLIGEMIRYVIIFKDDNLLEDYIIKLIKAMDAGKNIAELNMIRDTTYASKIVSMITKRKRKITQEELNEKVFDYMYKNLITYGYVFHAFNHNLSESILKYGLDVTKKSWEDIKIEQIENILKKYGIVEPFTDYKLFSKEGLAFTSNFNKIHSYAKKSPAFLSNFIINTKNEKAELAIYNKDIGEIKNIVMDYLDKNKVTEEDKEFVMLFLEDNLEYYFNEKSTPAVALVERNSIEFLKGMYISYAKYLETTSERDVDEYSIVSYILNVQDNFNDFRLKEKIKKDEVMLVNLPEYKAKNSFKYNMKAEKVQKQEENTVKVEDISIEEPIENINIEDKPMKVVKIKGDILFGYVAVKTSLNKIKENFENNRKYEYTIGRIEGLEEVKEDNNEEFTLSFTSLNDKKDSKKKEKEEVKEEAKEENNEEFTLSFTSLNDKKDSKKKEKEEEKEDNNEEFTLSFTSLNDKKDSKKQEKEEKLELSNQSLNKNKDKNIDNYNNKFTLNLENISEDKEEVEDSKFTLDLEEINEDKKDLKDNKKIEIIEESEEVEEKQEEVENTFENLEEESNETETKDIIEEVEISKEKEDLMNNFATMEDTHIDILGEIEKRIQESLEKENLNNKEKNALEVEKEEIDSKEDALELEKEEIDSKEDALEAEKEEIDSKKVNVIEEIPEEIVEEILPVEEDIEEIKPKIEKQEVVVEKVVVEKITKKYKVQSKKVKIKRKGELTTKEKIDRTIERAHRRKQEEEKLKLENEVLLKKELENIEKFALEIINEISEKVEKEVEIVKKTKIFKDNMTKEELDEFNQNVINKICASNIEEEVVSNKIKDYNPIEEYEKRIANMDFKQPEIEVENEYDPIAEYEKQLEIEKENESTYKAKIEELFNEPKEEAEDKFGETIEIPLDKIKEGLLDVSKTETEEDCKNEEKEEPVKLEVIEMEEEEENPVEITETLNDEKLTEEEIKETLKEAKVEPIIPITLLKEQVEDDTQVKKIVEEPEIKQVFEIEDEEISVEEKIEDEEDFTDLVSDETEENVDVEEEVEENTTKKYKGLNLPKFNKTEIKPETKKVIEKLKEKALGLITTTEEVEEENEDVVEETVEPNENNTKEVKGNYRELAVCNTDDIDVSMYLNNVISNKVYENTDEEQKEKQEVIDKLLEETKPIKQEVEEVEKVELGEEETSKIEEDEVYETENNLEDLKTETAENLDSTSTEDIEEIKTVENAEIVDNTEIDEYKNEEENSIETEEESLEPVKDKNELSEEEILKLVQEDELYMDDPSYITKGKSENKYKDIIPNDMETSLIVKTTLMESFKLALKDFTRKVASGFTSSFDEENYENRVSRSQKIRRSPRLNEFSTYNDYKKTNKIDRVVNLMEDKSLRERRPRLSKEQKDEMIRCEKESFIENLYKEINTNSIKKSMYNRK